MFNPPPSHTILAVDRADLATQDASVISSWASRHTSIPAASTWDDLIAAIQGRHTGSQRLRGDSNAFHALLTLHAEGDTRAGKVVLHAMYPLMAHSFVRLRYQYASDDDAISAIIMAMWTVIASFPLHRSPEKTLSNLTGEFKKHLCGTKAPQRQTDLEEEVARDDDLTTWAESPLATTTPTGIEEHLFPAPSDATALDLLSSAFDAEALALDEVKLLLDLYIEEIPSSEAAEHLGISPVLLRQRKCRALKKLRSWAATSF